MRGAPPLSPSPEVQRLDFNVDKCGGRQRSRAGLRIDTGSNLRFVSFRPVSDSTLRTKPPYQYYGGQNATAQDRTPPQDKTQRHLKEQKSGQSGPKCHAATCDITFGCYSDVMKEKARCQIRLEPIVHERLKALAGECDLSLNQLVEGILAWAGANAHPGIPKPRSDKPTIESDSSSHVVWFGNDGIVRDRKGKPIDINGPGQISFMLDFRAARATVDGWEIENVK